MWKRENADSKKGGTTPVTSTPKPGTTTQVTTPASGDMEDFDMSEIDTGQAALPGNGVAAATTNRVAAATSTGVERARVTTYAQSGLVEYWRKEKVFYEDKISRLEGRLKVIKEPQPTSEAVGARQAEAVRRMEAVVTALKTALDVCKDALGSAQTEEREAVQLEKLFGS